MPERMETCKEQNMEQRKYAVLIYPDFSLQEVSCLTSALAVWFGEKIDVIAAENKPYRSEEGFSRTKRRTRRTPPVTPASSSRAPSTPFPPFSTAG